MLQTLKKFFNFCGEDNRKLFIAAIWLGVLSAICTAMRIPAAYIVIVALLENNVTTTTLWSSLAIVVGSVLVSIAINMKSTMLQTRGGYRTCANKRIEIAEHLRYLPMGWFNANSLGEVASVTTNTMENMANIATRVIMMTTKGFLTAGVIAMMMLISDWRMGLVTLAGLLVFFLVNTLMQRNEQAVSQRKFNADERLVAKVLEYVQGIAEVKNFDLTKDSTTQVGDAVDECRKAAFGMEVPSVIFTFLQFLANKFTGVAVCASALVFYFNGTMPLAMCLMMLICSFILFEQLDSAGSYSTLFRSIDIGVEKANAILHVPPMDIDGQDILPERCDIALEHVDFSYDQKKILDDVSLTIPEKTTVAIVGPSGSGKTTLCHLMARFWDVQGGRVTLGGRDVRAYSYDSLMRNFSFVFQRTYLFSDTIANNIRFGKPDASMEEIRKAAQIACVDDAIMSFPDGYDTLVGERGVTLSGGQRQRVAIARMLLSRSPVMIFDDSLSAVDAKTDYQIRSALQKERGESTLILISHRITTLMGADQILVLNQGKMEELGTHEELIEKEGIYRKIYEIQMSHDDRRQVRE